jgi:hypothetical protein
MLLHKNDFKELTGYSYEELGIKFQKLYSKKEFFIVLDEDLKNLFSRVRELSFEEGQNNLLDCGYSL